MCCCWTSNQQLRPACAPPPLPRPGRLAGCYVLVSHDRRLLELVRIAQVGAAPALARRATRECCGRHQDAESDAPVDTAQRLSMKRGRGQAVMVRLARGSLIGLVLISLYRLLVGRIRSGGSVAA